MTTGQSNRIKCVCYNNLLNNPFIALKIQLPDFDPAETFPLRADRQYIGHIPRCTWREEIFANERVHLPDLLHLIKRGPARTYPPGSEIAIAVRAAMPSPEAPRT